MAASVKQQFYRMMLCSAGGSPATLSHPSIRLLIIITQTLA